MSGFGSLSLLRDANAAASTSDFSRPFRYTSYAQEVIFGNGSLARLRDAVERFGWQRLLLVTSGSARRGGRAAQLEEALGSHLVASYDRVQPHVQDFQIAEALTLAEQNGIDAIIGLGGGSPIGLAKAVSQALEEKRTGHPARAAFPTDQPLVPVIAIPTTYAGSENTSVYGVTQRAGDAPAKVTVSDPKVTPKLVLYDPLLTLDLPPDLTASSGINALAHCVEAVYSSTRHPLSTAAALTGARYIARALPRCFADGQDIAARTEMLVGAHLAGVALSSVTMGLHHGLCHVLGGTAGVPHGIANAIVLPHAMRFDHDAIASELAQIAEALGIAREDHGDATLAESAAQWVYDLAGQLQLPQRLRQVDVKQSDLPRLAELASRSRTVQNDPRPVSAAQLEQLLYEMW